jgi:SWI/SNF-related matrix-associated actin-dependent regulator of chromatin subfamily A member 5
LRVAAGKNVASSTAEVGDEGESQVREHVKQAMAASKAGEGNAWMKMMNLYVLVRAL